MNTQHKNELHALSAAVIAYTMVLCFASFSQPGVRWADLMVNAGLQRLGDQDYSPNLHGLIGWWFIGVAVMLLLWDLVRSYERKRSTLT